MCSPRLFVADSYPSFSCHAQRGIRSCSLSLSGSSMDKGTIRVWDNWLDVQCTRRLSHEKRVAFETIRRWHYLGNNREELEGALQGNSQQGTVIGKCWSCTLIIRARREWWLADLRGSDGDYQVIAGSSCNCCACWLRKFMPVREFTSRIPKYSDLILESV